MAINVSKNLKKSVTAPELKDLAWTAVGATTYLMLPTVLKQNGWAGLGIAAGGTWLLGAIFDIRGLRAAAVGVATAHLMYGFANDTVNKTIGTPIWKFNAGLGDAMPAQLPEGSGVVQNRTTGEYILAQQPTDLPAVAAQGVMDYVTEEAGVNDYAMLPMGRSTGRFLP